METWTQNYDPAGNIAVSAGIAAIPVVVLLGLLALFHVRAHIAALLGLACSLAIAIVIFGMPIRLAMFAALDGALFGLFPIGWIVLTAIFVYDVTVHCGQFEVLRRAIAGVSGDRRIQVLLIAFSFGAFIEGAAGFGTPVAISAAMLIGLGFKPLQAAGLALIGNTAPVAFGALGTPLLTLAKVTDLPLDQLSMMVGRQLPLFSLLVPFWLIVAMAGWRGMYEVWPACLTAGFSFGSMQFLVSHYHGPWLVDVIGSVISILCLVILLRFWQPAPESTETVRSHGDDNDHSLALETKPSPKETGKALMPWALLCGLVFIWGTPQVKTWINQRTTVKFAIPYLHNAVERTMPVVATPTAEKAEYELNLVSATGTALFVTGCLAGLLLKLSPLQLAMIFITTIRRTAVSLLTIAAMLALGFTTRYSGLDATMGLAMASTGLLFPFFSPLLGWLGVALTGSDTSSNVLFGNLQQITAERLGISPILAAASNSSGGVMGKMIDAQSIVVASVATGQQGEEGKILRYVFFHSVALAILVGLLVAAQATVLSDMIPGQ